mmetsp:Transcript_29716/g.43930  ORF Transcript_29716/g.43930 Transcript_29716/m.43930 type:complete len:150 (+) Transcript_29716:382-831(+)
MDYPFKLLYYRLRILETLWCPRIVNSSFGCNFQTKFCAIPTTLPFLNRDIIRPQTFLNARVRFIVCVDLIVLEKTKTIFGNFTLSLGDIVKGAIIAMLVWNRMVLSSCEKSRPAIREHKPYGMDVPINWLDKTSLLHKIRDFALFCISY